MIILGAIGGIYTGVFTPVETAGCGAFLAAIMLVVRGGVSAATLRAVAADTLRTTDMVFLILIGASVFTPFIALSGLPAIITGAFTEAGLGP
jgi:TRAP-type C4-dicarboxylate transport system permease large subunit